MSNWTDATTYESRPAQFDWNTASLMSVIMQPGYDWQVFLDELARLERAALGDVVYGKSRYESTT